MSIGGNIQTARKRAGLTQEQLAQECGVATITIQQYERNKREPNVDMIAKIADTLNVTVGYLQDRETIDTRSILDAMKVKDYATAEKLLGLPPGSIIPIHEREMEHIDAMLAQAQQEKEAVLNKLRLYFRIRYANLSEKDYLSIKNLIDHFSQLNDVGQQKAIERVEELTEIPKYQK